MVLLGLGALTALFILIAPLLMRPFHPVDPSLTVGLARVLFPIVALLGVSGIVVGILNSYDEFSIPALAPVAWNVAIIAGLAIGVPNAHTASAKLYVYAGSILAATVILVLLPVPWLRGKDDRLRGPPASRARRRERRLDQRTPRVHTASFDRRRKLRLCDDVGKAAVAAGPYRWGTTPTPTRCAARPRTAGEARLAR